MRETVQGAFCRQTRLKDGVDRWCGTKAQRSFRIACRLQERGVGTPAPVACLERVSVGRVIETVDTAFGPIRVKVARWPEGSRAMPEYEDCRQAAQTHHVPLAQVMAAAREKATQQP